MTARRKKRARGEEEVHMTGERPPEVGGAGSAGKKSGSEGAAKEE
jgi:hypothetical protein